MTTPDIPLRMELTLELPGSPEQVWDAIATAEGISSWFLRTDLEPHEGGAIVTYMGEDESSPGTVTGWEPPRRFSYEEPGWAALGGHEDAAVTPLATEFLVEAKSGGSCVVRVVSSAFGTGADWEGEFFAEMERYWTPYFDHLRLYLSRFPGQRATSLSVAADVPGPTEAVLAAMRQALGAGDVGQPFETLGLSGQVERMGEVALLLRLTDPLPGYMGLFAMAKEDSASAAIEGYLFSPDAPSYVERERAAWKAWLEALGTTAARR